MGPVMGCPGLGVATAGTALSTVQGTDWFGVGALLAIAGGFLLAAALPFRHPRSLVEQRFGAIDRRLASIREYVFHRVQVQLGFLLLVAGFALELYGHRQAAAPAAPAGAGSGVSAVWVGGLVLGVAVLLLGAWWWAQLLARGYVREFVRRQGDKLDLDAGLVRELGELFGVPPRAEDTVPSYWLRIRARMGLSDPAPARARGPRSGPHELALGDGGLGDLGSEPGEEIA